MPLSTTDANRPPPFASHLREWDIPNQPQLPSPPTTSLMGTMTPKASKSNHQRFNWLKCRNSQHQFKYLWQKSILNRTDYASKHHPAQHHQNIHPFYVFDSTSCLHSKKPTRKLIGYMRGCVKYSHIQTRHKAVSKYPKVITCLYPSSQLTWLLQN